MSAHVSRTVHGPAGAAGLLTVLLLLAGCGGSDDAGTEGAGGTAGGGATVQTGQTDYGDVLVDSTGRTLYAFDADSPGTSTCTGSCLENWPVVEATGTVSHSADVTAELATITRDDGTIQLTVNGWPAYTYVSDTGPGAATGQGLDLSGGHWWVFGPAGKQVTTTDLPEPDQSAGVGGY